MEEAGLSWRELWVATTARLGDPMEARWVCEHASGFYGLQWVLGLDSLAGERAVHRLDVMVARRLTGEPLQYVLGSWAFRRLELMVDRRVLIPRPETEEVVDAALALARAMPRPLTLVDLGTGSGAIALSLKSERPDAEVVACDISQDALDVAAANAARLGLDVELHLSDLLAQVPGDGFSLVVSNPPYVSEQEMADLEPEVAEHEPRLATVAGPDGLEVYRRLLPEAAARLVDGGSLALECGYGQATALVGELAAAGFGPVGVDPDLAGIERVVWARWR